MIDFKPPPRYCAIPDGTAAVGQQVIARKKLVFVLISVRERFLSFEFHVLYCVRRIPTRLVCLLVEVDVITVSLRSKQNKQPGCSDIVVLCVI